MLLDIHSHILPNVDDGAKNIDESICLLKDMLSQGITDVIATPHFYPHLDSLENFKQKTSAAFNRLKKITENENLPNIYLGCEVLYYSGISKVPAITNFTLNNSNYILLELNPHLINRTLQSEILHLKTQVGLIPIIPHIERYYKAKGFKDLIQFISENKILTQLNATSLFNKRYNKVIDKLFSENIITFIATDTHSLEKRPPLMKPALDIIGRRFGQEYKYKFIINSNILYNQIVDKGHAANEFK